MVGRLHSFGPEVTQKEHQVEWSVEESSSDMTVRKERERERKRQREIELCSLGAKCEYKGTPLVTSFLHSYLNCLLFNHLVNPSVDKFTHHIMALIISSFHL